MVNYKLDDPSGTGEYLETSVIKTIRPNASSSALKGFVVLLERYYTTMFFTGDL